jgi:hypothetical protein
MYFAMLMTVLTRTRSERIVREDLRSLKQSVSRVLANFERVTSPKRERDTGLYRPPIRHLVRSIRTKLIPLLVPPPELLCSSGVGGSKLPGSPWPCCAYRERLTQRYAAVGKTEERLTLRDIIRRDVVVNPSSSRRLALAIELSSTSTM